MSSQFRSLNSAKGFSPLRKLTFSIRESKHFHLHRLPRYDFIIQCVKLRLRNLKALLRKKEGKGRLNTNSTLSLSRSFTARHVARHEIPARATDIEVEARKQPERHAGSFFSFFEVFLYYIKKTHKIKKGSINIYLRSPSKSLSVQQP